MGQVSWPSCPYQAYNRLNGKKGAFLTLEKYLSLKSVGNAIIESNTIDNYALVFNSTQHNIPCYFSQRNKYAS
jgi:hypothetical protein